MAEQDPIECKRIAVIGGGSWATAIAKIFHEKKDRITWYMRQDRIEDFKELGHNPAYLADVKFDLDRIDFEPDINKVARDCDILIFAVPSPYLKTHLAKLTEDISGKIVVSAIKGVVPEENITVSQYFNRDYHVPADNIIVVSGPSHAEEIALERLTYLTCACSDRTLAQAFADMMSSRYVRTSVSDDVVGIEFGAVLKNIYAIIAGIYFGQKYGDNFHAVLISNAVREMRRFLDVISPKDGRDICSSAYLGDLLVTGYSQFSRNRVFGTMIGRGYSVKAAQIEMQMVVEGHYGTKCVKEINSNYHIHMPILDTVYHILYGGANVKEALEELTRQFN